MTSQTILEETGILTSIDYVTLAGVAALAFANGANDVSKSVASLVAQLRMRQPSRVSYPFLLAGFFTGLGGITAFVIAGKLLDLFVRGIVNVNLPSSVALAALAGATGWVVLATAVRIPVSTTHAIIGALVFEGALVSGTNGVAWASLISSVFLPLALSPLLAFAMVYVLHSVGLRTILVSLGPIVTRTSSLQWSCPKTRSYGTSLSLAASTAATAFARALNDTPKIVALGVLAYSGGLGSTSLSLFLLVASAMVIGSVAAGRRVTETLAWKTTFLENQGALRVGLSTASLVSLGAYSGLPMSTTHVASGAIIAEGLIRRRVFWPVVRGMILTWIITLPGAGIMAILMTFFGRIIP